MDDWTATGRSLVEWAETFCDWVEAERQKRQVTMLIGNHDVPYLLEADTPEYARVRDYGTPGFHAKAQRKVFAILSGRLHELSTVWHDGHVLASHAGFTGSWLNGWPYGQPNTPISISLMFPGEPSKLASAYCQAGAARGGDSAPSPTHHLPAWRRNPHVPVRRQSRGMAERRPATAEGQRRRDLRGHQPEPDIRWIPVGVRARQPA